VTLTWVVFLFFYSKAPADSLCKSQHLRRIFARPFRKKAPLNLSSHCAGSYLIPFWSLLFPCLEVFCPSAFFRLSLGFTSPVFSTLPSGYPDLISLFCRAFSNGYPVAHPRFVTQSDKDKSGMDFRVHSFLCTFLPLQTLPDFVSPLICHKV